MTKMTKVTVRVNKKTGKGTIVKRDGRPVKRKALTSLVKKVVKGQLETKSVALYGGAVQGVPISNTNGLYTNQASVSQNQFISNNTTDILKIIPDVVPGLGDNQRVGRQIAPVSCKLHCKVMISPTSTGGLGFQNGIAYDLTMVAYCLQSVTFKTYRALYASNDFTKMLDVMDGTTTRFDGTFGAAQLPVEKGYYRVLHKKTKLLRSSGAYVANGAPPQVGAITNNNSHPNEHSWTWNVPLPAKLQYPEENVAVADGQEEPLNASPFWCVGYFKNDGTVSGQAQIFIQQQYTSILRYKDA